VTFQHFAMLTPDIQASYATLSGMAGWRAVSGNGPVKLPASSGGATAFKFRDPEGHPLEFLQLASPAPARIDHTAIVVADTRASVAFYQARGFTVQGGSLNEGPEQATLDALSSPVLEVTRLGDREKKLYLELLCYRSPRSRRPTADKASNDAWATRLVFSGTGDDQLDRDPDGHDIFTTQTP